MAQSIRVIRELGAGGPSLCAQSMSPETQRRRALPLAHGQLIYFHLPLEHPSPCRTRAGHRGTGFQVGRRRSLQWNGCWMQTQQLRPRHSQEHSRMPPWTHRLQEKRQLSWRKPSGSPFIMLFSCGLDGIRASPLPCPCWSWGEGALERISAGSSVSVPAHECIGSNMHRSSPSPAWDWGMLEYCRKKRRGCLRICALFASRVWRREGQRRKLELN